MQKSLISRTFDRLIDRLFGRFITRWSLNHEPIASMFAYSGEERSRLLAERQTLQTDLEYLMQCVDYYMCALERIVSEYYHDTLKLKVLEDAQHELRQLSSAYETLIVRAKMVLEPH